MPILKVKKLVAVNIDGLPARSHRTIDSLDIYELSPDSGWTSARLDSGKASKIIYFTWAAIRNPIASPMQFFN